MIKVPQTGYASLLLARTFSMLDDHLVQNTPTNNNRNQGVPFEECESFPL